MVGLQKLCMLLFVVAVNFDINVGIAVKEDKLWDGGKIRFVISSSMSREERLVVKSSISNFNRNTCVRWVQRKGHKDYVKFEKLPDNGGCWSYVGKIGGEQKIGLGPKCFEKSTVLHQMMHAVGFYHEHARPDRDDYIDVRWNNILPSHLRNFQKYTRDQVGPIHTPYDCNSILHYGKTTYAKRSGLKTIVPKAKGCENIGEAKELSPLDIQDVALTYGCGS